MRKRLEIFGDVEIFAETNSFGLDFVEWTESGLRHTNPDIGAVL